MALRSSAVEMAIPSVAANAGAPAKLMVKAIANARSMVNSLFFMKVFLLSLKNCFLLYFQYALSISSSFGKKLPFPRNVDF